jgi:ethanolamine utilization microcompartment shell protein EutS
MAFERLAGAGLDVRQQADLQRNALVEHVPGEAAHFHHLAGVVDRHVVEQAHGMADAVGPAPLDGLPDRILAEGLAGVDGDVEIGALDEMEGFHVALGRVAALVAGKVESDHPAAAVGDRQLGHFQRGTRIQIPHRTDDQPPLDPGLLPAAVAAGQHRVHHVFEREAAGGMESGVETQLDVANVLGGGVEDRLPRHPFQRRLVLHHRDGRGETLQIQRQAAAPGAAVEPGRQFPRRACRQIHPGAFGQLEDRCRAQAAVEVLVQQDLRHPAHQFLVQRRPSGYQHPSTIHTPPGKASPTPQSHFVRQIGFDGLWEHAARGASKRNAARTGKDQPQ